MFSNTRILNHLAARPFQQGKFLNRQNLIRAEQARQRLANLNHVNRRPAHFHVQRPIGRLMQGELRQREPVEHASHVERVDHLSPPAAIDRGRAAFEIDEHRLIALELEAGKIVGAVTEQRQKEVEAARQCDFAPDSRRTRLAIGIEDLDLEAMLKEDVDAVVQNRNRTGLVHRIHVEHRAAEVGFESLAESRQEHHDG